MVVSNTKTRIIVKSDSSDVYRVVALARESSSKRHDDERIFSSARNTSSEDDPPHDYLINSFSTISHCLTSRPCAVELLFVSWILTAGIAWSHLQHANILSAIQCDLLENIHSPLDRVLLNFILLVSRKFTHKKSYKNNSTNGNAFSVIILTHQSMIDSLELVRGRVLCRVHCPASDQNLDESVMMMTSSKACTFDAAEHYHPRAYWFFQQIIRWLLGKGRRNM